MPSRIHQAVNDANGDRFKISSQFTKEYEDIADDFSLGQITEDEYKAAKSILDNAYNEHVLRNEFKPFEAAKQEDKQVAQEKATPATQEINPDELEKRLQKATEDVATAYRDKKEDI